VNSDTFEQILNRRLQRRDFVKASAATLLLLTTPQSNGAVDDQLFFAPILSNSLDFITLPSGYTSQVLLRWGDPVIPGAPLFNIDSQTPEGQSGQFGFNADFVGFFPFWGGPFTSKAAPPMGATDSYWGLLAVNHEYTDEIMMFAGYISGAPTRNQVDVALAAHGVSIVEIWNGVATGWNYDRTSPFNPKLPPQSRV
jgi:secreted PhoX family phosphatase